MQGNALRSGFFTVAVANNFRSCIIADSSPELVKLARQNLALNHVGNVRVMRRSAIGMLESWKSRSLPGLNAPSTLLVDPTRHGLDAAVREFLPDFDNILYISCNPQTMSRDLRHTTATHHVSQLAFFDQFPHTDHMECGMLLTRTKNQQMRLLSRTAR